MQFLRPCHRELRARIESIPSDECFPESGFFPRIREVVIVASSSRSGSSVFTRALARTGAFVTLSAEINPFLRLCGLTACESETGSDQLTGEDARDGRADALERMLWEYVGVPTNTLDTPLDVERFASDVARRVALQWPRELIDDRRVAAFVHEVLDELCRNHHWKRHRFDDPDLFYALLLRRLRNEYPRVNPRYYDFANAGQQSFGDVPKPQGPPSPWIVEEPPFVTPTPRRRPMGEELEDRPLLIKTPSNAYRLGFLRELFRNARFRVVHLTRNPAASINGLIDGWLHPGFHAHAFDAPLGIDGLPDPDRHWWKFDLPPGWQDFAARPLPEVCAFQWRSANRAILDFVDCERVETARVGFEGIVADPHSRILALRGLFEWLGVEADEANAAAFSQPLPPTMTTRPPRRQRWRERSALLEPLLADRDTRELVERLGCNDRSAWL